MRFVSVVLGAVAVLGCDAAPAGADAGPAADAGSSDGPSTHGLASGPAPAPAPIGGAEPPAPPEGDGPLGPAPPGPATTKAQREAAVLELLAGAAPTDRLVREDVDPGASFDADRRDRVAPTGPVGGRPRLTQGDPVVGAGLDRAIVRRIARQHSNELRHCYNQGLVRDPGLSGTVTLAFTIAVDGTVSTSAQQASTLRGRTGTLVGSCMVQATRRWRFPEPEGGAPVGVVYPITVSTQ